MSGSLVGFAIVAVLALAGAFGVVIARQPVHSALFLIINVIALAVLYLMLSAEFLAAAQVIVYAGAIMVLFLFVVTLLTAGKAEHELPEELPGQRWAGGIVSIVVGIGLAAVALANPGKPAAGLSANFGNLQAMATILWGPGFIDLAAVAIMLLTAVLGVLVLNRPRPRSAVRRRRRTGEGQA